MIKKSHLAPFKLAFYGLFSLYLVTDLCLCSGPLRMSLDKKLQQEGLSEGALREQNAVAKIYGEIITRDELDTRFREELYLKGKKESDFSPKELFAQRIATLNRMVEDSLLRLKTKINDMRRPVDETEVEREWLQFITRFRNEAELDAALEKQGLTRKIMKMRIEARLQQEAQLNANIADAVEPPEEEIKTAYQNLIDAAPPRKSRELSHIFFPTLNENVEKIKTEAEEALTQIKAGTPFSDLAKKISRDPRSAPQGGQLGTITDDRKLPGGLLEIIFNLPDNTPVLEQSPLGYHIFLAGQVTPIALPPYEELKPSLRNALVSLRKQEAIDLYLKHIKAEARVKNLIVIYHKNV